jgi:peptidyl-dipeptidase A
VDEMWKQVKPLYNELHTFVRRKLQKMYSDKMDKNSEMIPAHLLGNMWYVVLLKIVNLISIDLSCIFLRAQSWVNLYDKIKPFEKGSLINIDEKLKSTMSVLDIFKESDKFFMGLGLEPNDMSYNETRGAVINKPTDRIITCHASVRIFS